MTKAIILSAGRGTRMRPLSDTTPKPLIEINGKPLIVYHLEKLAHAGISDVVINLDYLGDKIAKALGNGQSFGVNIEYSHEKQGALGTAGGIIHALPLLGNDTFIVISCDIWSKFDYALLPRKIETMAHLLLVDNPSHHVDGDFCLVDGNTLALKNAHAQTYTYAGIGVFQAQLFSACSQGFCELGPFLSAAIQDSVTLSGEHFSGQWSDIGTPGRLKALENALGSTLRR